MYNQAELKIIKKIEQGLTIYWASVDYEYELSEEFIREFSNKVTWWAICSYQTLSGSFIEEFQDKVVWRDISYSQKLSKKFIIKFLDKLHLHQIPLCYISNKTQHSWKTFL